MNKVYQSGTNLRLARLNLPMELQTDLEQPLPLGGLRFCFLHCVTLNGQDLGNIGRC